MQGHNGPFVPPAQHQCKWVHRGVQENGTANSGRLHCSHQRRRQGLLSLLLRHCQGIQAAPPGPYGLAIGMSAGPGLLLCGY